LKAERAWFLSEEERRAKPETEQLLPRWGKSCVFLNSLARASLQNGFLNTHPDPFISRKKRSFLSMFIKRGQTTSLWGLSSSSLILNKIRSLSPEKLTCFLYLNV